MIEVNGLKYSYGKSKELVLKGLDFHLKEGEIFGFLGPSGAGKSTTQKILIGLLQQYQGRAAIEGREVSSWDRELYSRIGVGFELPRFYQRFTAMENLKIFAGLYPGQKENPSELLERFGLEGHGEKTVGEFSKGMKTRLGLCRAFLHKPKLLFLDEPTTGLDPTTSKMVRDLLKEQKKQGRSIFLTTHSMETATEVCDRVAFLNQGNIVESGAPQDLMRKYGTRDVIVEISNENGKVESHFPMDNLHSNADFLAFLQRGKLLSIHSKECSLGDIFINLTGRGLA